MMEKDEQLIDNLLKKIVPEDQSEGPSAGFIEGVMKKIETAPDIVPVSKPVFLSWRTGLTILSGIILLVIIILTSDIPYLSFIPASDYFSEILWPYLVNTFTGGIFRYSGKFFTFGLLVAAAGCTLIMAEKIFSYGLSMRKRMV